MNYFNQVRAFYDRLPSLSLSPGQIALWHALMHMCNRLGWPQKFYADTKSIVALSALSESGVHKGIGALVSCGLLEKERRPGRTSQYRLTNLYFTKNTDSQFSEQSNAQKSECTSPCQANTQSTAQGAVSTTKGLIKKEETIQDKKEKTPFPKVNAKDEQEQPDCIPSEVCERVLGELSKSTKIKYTLSEPIRALLNKRWQEGYRQEDLMLVVQKKCQDWMPSDKMRPYLRPQTLFGEKFEQYVKAAQSDETPEGDVHGEFLAGMQRF